MLTVLLFQLILIGLLKRNQITFQSFVIGLLLFVLAHQLAHLTVIVFFELLQGCIVIGFELASVCLV